MKMIYRGHELDENVWIRIKNDPLFKLMFDEALDGLYQPERSKREDLNVCIICKKTISSILHLKNDECEDCHYKIVKKIHSRCGALNTMET